MTRRLGIACILTAPLGALALLLLGCAGTLEGRLAALCTLALVAAVLLALARRPKAARCALAALVLGGVVLLLRAPSGQPARHASLRAVYLRGGGPARFAPTNLVPEVDQLVLATFFVWIPDPCMTWGGAARLRGAIRAAYADTLHLPEARALGTALGDALTDRDTGRVFVYEPPHAPLERRPALLFLHGSAGSWKGYFYTLHELARRRRFALVQPSFGFGQWSRPEGRVTLERTRAWLAAQPWVDPAQIYLVCLSNGGRAVTRLLRAETARYRGVVFVSAVIEPRVLDAGVVDRSWHRVPMLVLHGADDDRIPVSYLQDGLDALRDQHLTVTPVVFPREDHFLIFTDPTAVRRALDTWLDAVGSSPLPPRPDGREHLVGVPVHPNPREHPGHPSISTEDEGGSRQEGPRGG